MNTVKRAIIMAAGKGERLHPVTLSVPKPLLPVRGVRMIDSIVRALHMNGIFEIHVVVGYRRDAFEGLAVENPGLTLVDNPWYDTCNNISSLYVARQFLSDVIILDGDQLIFDPNVLAPQFERSGYNAVWTDEPTKEWVLSLGDNGAIAGCSRTGGPRGWRLVSISRWSDEDGARLRRFVEEEFQGGNRNIYWDDVALFCRPEFFQLGIRPMSADATMEIDTLKELVAFDPAYANLEPST